MGAKRVSRHSDALVAWVDALIAERPDCWRRGMFGHPAFMAGGHLFAVVSGEGLALRLPEGMADALTGPAYGDFAPGGRPFRHWVLVQHPDLAGFTGEIPLIETAIAHARDLPLSHPVRRGPRRGLSG